MLLPSYISLELVVVGIEGRDVGLRKSVSQLVNSMLNNECTYLETLARTDASDELLDLAALVEGR